MKVIDLFCGAGGTTTGVHLSGKAEVIACINHDATAIKSHAANYPNCKHYIEDIRLFDEKILPLCDIITMSAECTHFSIAKGGESRNADSRTLSEELYRYIAHCNPTYIVVENVKEFLTWAELVQKKDKQGNLVFKPNGEPYMIPDTDVFNKGKKYREWVRTIKAMEYEYKYKVLNSADFGAYTSRLRYFGIFAKKGNAIRFPKPTHAEKGCENTVPKWKSVRELLDFENKGTSIFDRSKPLSEKTLKRIYAGLQKFVPNEANWIVKWLSNNPRTGINSGKSCNVPLDTIACQNRLGLASVEFNTPQPKENVFTAFMDKYYGISNAQPLTKPCCTITTVDRFSLIQAEHGNTNTMIQANDSPYTKLIKEFMQANGIKDITMRMLTVQELKEIQGFPKDYILLGNQAQQKKFIGNSVVPQQMESIIKSLVA